MRKVSVFVVVAVVEATVVFLDFRFENRKRSICFEEACFESAELPISLFCSCGEFFY